MWTSKSEAREIDFLYGREKDAMLTVWAKIPRHEGTSRHAAFIYLVGEFFFLFLV